jgi:hypothetical protein
MPAANTTGYALHIQTSSSVVASNNVLRNQGLGATLYMESTGLNTANITIKGNQVLGGADEASTGCIQITGDGTAYCVGLNLSDNQVVPNPGGAGTAAIWINNSSVKGGKVSGNYANVATMPALTIAGCVGIRCTENILESTGTNSVTLTGTCTGSFFDKTNLLAGGVIVNSASGFHVDQFGPSAPASGTYAVGDTIYNDFTSTTTNGQWMCTVAGTPGTFVGHV